MTESNFNANCKQFKLSIMIFLHFDIVKTSEELRQIQGTSYTSFSNLKAIESVGCVSLR